MLLEMLENARQRVRPPNGHMSSSQNSARTVPNVELPRSHSQPQPTYRQPLFPRKSTSHSKRHSSEGEDDEDNSPKRRKSTTGPDGSRSIIDETQSRRRYGPTPEPETAQLGLSNNTSNVSLSRSIFDGGGHSFPTQTTVDATSPGPKRISPSKANGMLSSPNKSHLHPRPDTAMQPSQSPHYRHPAGSMENPISLDTIPRPLNRVRHRPPSSPTDTDTIYSSVPGMEDNDSLWNMTTNARVPEPTSLEARLQNIWRKFSVFCWKS